MTTDFFRGVGKGDKSEVIRNIWLMAYLSVVLSLGTGEHAVFGYELDSGCIALRGMGYRALYTHKEVSFCFPGCLLQMGFYFCKKNLFPGRAL